jgi:hypothetical protein
MSQRKLAKKFNVSRRLIQFVIAPEKYDENLKRREERGGSKAYYDRLSHNLAMKKHRRKKYEILTKLG